MGWQSCRVNLWIHSTYVKVLITTKIKQFFIPYCTVFNCFQAAGEPLFLFMDTGEWGTWEDYLDRMRRPGEWGDPLTILSGANTNGVDIDIYQSTGTSESSI